MVVDLMRIATTLTTTSIGRMVVHHLSAARHSSGSPQRHPERAFGRRSQGAALAHLHDIAVRYSGLWRCRVLRTTRRHEAAFTSGTIAPWFN
jgi:hypothetical protein